MAAPDSRTGPATPARDVRTYAAPWSTVLVEAAGGAVLVALAVATDAVGAVLASAAALAVLALAGFDALARPSLVAEPGGLDVHDGWRVRHYAWPQVTRVEVRAGRRVVVLPALEIDAGDDLVLLSRRRLGADLAEVAVRLAEYRAAYGTPAGR